MEKTTKERRYKLTLTVMDPDIPFVVKHQIGAESGDLVWVFAQFQLELIRLLKKLNEDDKLKEDDIPF